MIDRSNVSDEGEEQGSDGEPVRKPAMGRRVKVEPTRHHPRLKGRNQSQTDEMAVATAHLGRANQECGPVSVVKGLVRRLKAGSLDRSPFRPSGAMTDAVFNRPVEGRSVGPVWPPLTIFSIKGIVSCNLPKADVFQAVRDCQYLLNPSMNSAGVWVLFKITHHLLNECIPSGVTAVSDTGVDVPPHPTETPCSWELH
jgi:hypothetical protein